MKKAFILVIVFVLANALSASAQCAMCRATLENNISNGNIGIAAGINFGIMYLFFSPYIFILILAYLWYRTSKRNANKSVESHWAR
ncbi:MAG: hypothetical protein HY015_07240 [Bacteroidetes bacterium]|nr:hypothetical protein [Bacteroidota bacterium]MBI3482757.1 hypothetical protein [Bacteroidota bacterium]